MRYRNGVFLDLVGKVEQREKHSFKEVHRQYLLTPGTEFQLPWHL